MHEATTGSTVPRRQLGRHLRDLRGRARLTVKSAAKALEWSETKIWRIENGHTAMRSLDTEAMCRVYGASAEVTEYLMGLSKKTKEQGWWHSAYGNVIPDGFGLYIGLEEVASSMQWYEKDLVPGLFQISDYARVLIQHHVPTPPPEQVERSVELRAARSALLTRVSARPTIRLALNEGILRTPVGGPDVMARQLTHLAEMARLDTVSLRVVPFAQGMHLGLLSGPFVILRFPDNGTREGEPPVVYSENLVGELFLDKPLEVEHYDAAFESIWNAALSEQDSMRLVQQIQKEFTHEASRPDVAEE
ncbi:helix-turn-helix domain-containing protein [Actinokineospora inagensis]|uniref:helix-turn-helix domain-containing protein n=1 Tax=Actinokineospora inagensis TaxID=103730 RepID=UPI00041C7812|nr:helix-turn-helix transcriptional regulator [Actinokineospora inagensis]